MKRRINFNIFFIKLCIKLPVGSDSNVGVEETDFLDRELSSMLEDFISLHSTKHRQ